MVRRGPSYPGTCGSTCGEAGKKFMLLPDDGDKVVGLVRGAVLLQTLHPILEEGQAK